jgi:hypothetical protein
MYAIVLTEASSACLFCPEALGFVFMFSNFFVNLFLDAFYLGNPCSKIITCLNLKFLSCFRT